MIQPVLAVLFVYCYTALALFLVLHRLLHVSSAGILRPSCMVFFAVISNSPIRSIIKGGNSTGFSSGMARGHRET